MLLKVIASLILAGISTQIILWLAHWRINKGKFFISMLETLPSEQRALQAIIQDPYNFYWFASLNPEHFASKVFAELHPLLTTYFKNIAWFPDDLTSVDKAEAWLKNVKATHPIDLIFLQDTINQSFKTHHQKPLNAKALTSKELVEVINNLEYSLENKKDNNILSTIVKSDQGEHFVFQRLVKSFPNSLKVLTFLLLSTAFYSFFLLLVNSYSNYPLYTKSFIFLTLTLLLLSSFVWAVIDIYTMFLDFRFFMISTGLTFATFGLSLLLIRIEDPAIGLALFQTLLTPILILTFIKVILFIYKRVRGVEGMGGGDFWILFPVSSIPFFFIPLYQYAFQAFIFSNILGIIGWVVLFLQKKVTKTSPFAFGPYLAVGWVVVFSYYILAGISA